MPPSIRAISIDPFAVIQRLADREDLTFTGLPADLQLVVGLGGNLRKMGDAEISHHKRCAVTQHRSIVAWMKRSEIQVCSARP